MPSIAIQDPQNSRSAGILLDGKQLNGNVGLDGTVKAGGDQGTSAGPNDHNNQWTLLCVNEVGLFKVKSYY